MNAKVNRAREFLEHKDKVIVSVVFRGRENQHRNLGEEILMAIKDNLSSVGTVEGRPSMMGNRMSIMLAPNAHALKPVAAPKPAAPKPAAPQAAAPKPSPVLPPQAQPEPEQKPGTPGI